MNLIRSCEKICGNNITFYIVSINPIFRKGVYLNKIWLSIIGVIKDGIEEIYTLPKTMTHKNLIDLDYSIEEVKVDKKAMIRITEEEFIKELINY